MLNYCWFISTYLTHVFYHHVTRSNLRRYIPRHHNHRHRHFRYLVTYETLLEIVKKGFGFLGIRKLYPSGKWKTNEVV